jgi:hypothetical protein
MNIKELNELCRINNWSIRYNKYGIHNGFNTFDYSLK